MIINHNMSAINSQRQMYKTSTAQSKSTEKLSSGLRINRAGDDAAGLAISEKMRGQISGLNQASRNAQDAISLIQTAEGALDEQHSMLQRMRELAVQADNGTNTAEDRKQIQSEIDQLKGEITAITQKTEFNTKKLLNGDQDFKSASALTKAGSALTLKASVSAMKASIAERRASIETKLESVATKQASIDTKIAERDSKGIGTASYAALDGSVANLTISLGVMQASIATIQKSVDDKIESIATKLESVYDVQASADTLLLRDEKTGDASGGLTFQVGANSGQTIKVGIRSMKASDLGVDDVDVLNPTTNDGIASNLDKIDRAINMVSTQRSKLGAVQNRLEHTISNVDNAAENIQASESRIRDTDMAKEMMNLASKNVLAQATQAMLAQANQKPNQVLQLLQ